MFNECFGYTLLAALGVSQPQVAVMPAPQPYLQGSPWAWAFVSCEARPVSEGSAKQLYDIADVGQHAKLVRRLFACPALPALIAADQLSKNGDRNIGNLVFRGKHAFLAIDHADVLGGGDWQYGELWGTQTWARSKLIEDLVRVSDLDAQTKAAIYCAAQGVADRFFQIQGELRIALECRTSADTAAAMDSVWWRCTELATWFKDRLGLIV